MFRENVRIATALVLAFILVFFIGKRFFIGDSPKVDTFYIASIPTRGSLFLSSLLPKPETIVPSITQSKTDPFGFVTSALRPSAFPTNANSFNNPTTQPNITNSPPVPTSPNSTAIPTQSAQPTKKPKATKTPTKSPTSPPTSTSCPTSSSNSFSSMNVANPAGLTGNLNDHPEVNLHLRGYGENNESKSLQSRHGNNYGLDDKKPPQISTLYGGQVPTIVKTYDIYEWDFTNHRSLAPSRASPNFPVHMIGLSPGRGKALKGLEAGREIGGGNVFAVLYATKNDILFTHANSNNLEDGYLFYFLDLCVDPNLIAEYEKDAAAGKRQLPVIAPGQTFGTTSDNDVKIAIRDSWSFVDPRAKEDWWSYGQ